ncbi:DUF3619 family protein [Ramlibacter albus]|nr:DUF3619 family protein [Ramlibacter albus]
MTDEFGRKVASRLQQAAHELPYDISERLRAARVQAVAHRKVAQPRPARTVLGMGGAAALTFGEDGLNLWGRIASALPIIVLAGGLILIHTAQSERRASELAEVDVQLLTDDLPPQAYTDPGFAQFLRTGGQ